MWHFLIFFNLFPFPPFLQYSSTNGKQTTFELVLRILV